MRKIIVSEFITLDGVMEDPGGAEKFRYGGWTWPYHNDEIGKFKNDELFASDSLLMGRITYQGFAAAWPSRTDPDGFADRMNSLPKFVVSKTLNGVEWNNSKIIKEDIIQEVEKLKQQPAQDILVFGSGTLVRTLMQHRLIDEYRFLIYPVVLGTGKQLFRDADTITLKLNETKTFSTGVVLLRYLLDTKEVDRK